MADNSPKTTLAGLIDIAIVGCLFALALAAPHSIAGAQTAWLVGMALWVIRFIFHPRPKLQRTPIDYVLLGFFIITGLSAFLSYEPMESIGKLRAASLFTIIYLVAQNVPSLKVVRLLALTLIISCFGNVIFTLGQRVIGRGVKVHSVSQSSTLYGAGVRDGDTLLSVDGRSLRDPAQLVEALSQPSRAESEVRIYRFEWQPVFRVPHGQLKPGNSPTEQLGISGWSRGRDWRASGFYGHYVTYAEVLQLIFALTLGLFVCLPRKGRWMGVLLMIGLAGFLAALLLTVTRAVWLGCLVSSGLILLLTMRPRTMIVIAALALPLTLGGLFLLQQKRNVGFIDRSDDSTTWREIVWAEGADLLVSSPRHLLIGIGMDSIKKRAKQWGLFDGGRIPMGHMHSNFLQIALERGIPALLLWLAFLFAYAKTIWQALRQRSRLDWIERGILLGALGGLFGFLTSGIVHYNWGDSEVMQVFYLITGLTLVIHRHVQQPLATVDS